LYSTNLVLLFNC